MKSWRKWGMRALALAMLISLSAGPLMAVPGANRGGGGGPIDLLDGPGSVDTIGDPDGGGGGRASRFDEGDFRVSFVLNHFLRLMANFNPTFTRASVQLTMPASVLGAAEPKGTR